MSINKTFDLTSFEYFKTSNIANILEGSCDSKKIKLRYSLLSNWSLDVLLPKGDRNKVKRFIFVGKPVQGRDKGNNKNQDFKLFKSVELDQTLQK